MRIFLSAGEASGDALAAALVKELRTTGESFEFEGIGGRRLEAQIGKLFADSSRWGAISIVQSLSVAPRVSWGWLRARRRLSQGEPGLLVTIDFGFANIRLCRAAKKRGWKVLYLMPPSSWRRDKQGRDLPAITDAIVTPFPWSQEILKSIGGSPFFFGHPLKQLIRDSGITVDENRTRIAILPGSRTHELERNLPMIAKAVCGSAGDWTGGFDGTAIHDRLQIASNPLTETLEFAIAPNLNLEEVKATWSRLAPGRVDQFTQGDVYGVLARARAAIVCSGTATLEAALMRCPHVVIYRISKAMVREAKLVGFKLPKFIALPNIVLDRQIVPERVALDIDPAEVRQLLQPLLSDSPEREAQLQGFEEIDGILGPDDAITRTAELIVKMYSS